MNPAPWPTVALLKPMMIALAETTDVWSAALGPRHRITRHLVAALEQTRELLHETQEQELRQGRLPFEPAGRRHGDGDSHDGQQRRARIVEAMARFQERKR